MIKASEKKEKRVHPTQKPIALHEWVFEVSEAEKNILDLFGGSGSTLIACEKTDRKCFMMELDPHYCGVILDRWQKFTGKKAHREDGVSWDEIRGA
jgi:DNA modification methylase